MHLTSLQRSYSLYRCLGQRFRAQARPARALASFSPSPIHLETREEAEMEKKTAEMLVAMALPSIVLPVPGGPKSRIPLGGARAP